MAGVIPPSAGQNGCGTTSGPSLCEPFLSVLVVRPSHTSIQNCRSAPLPALYWFIPWSQPSSGPGHGGTAGYRPGWAPQDSAVTSLSSVRTRDGRCGLTRIVPARWACRALRARCCFRAR